MSNFAQYKKLQKYYLGSPVTPAEYKKGNINMIGDFDSLESCQSNVTPAYWIYPKGESNLYEENNGFTFTLDHSDTNYDYYVISGEGTSLNFQYIDVIQGNVLDVTNITSMEFMFYKCENLTSLVASGWDTSKVRNLKYMFSECWSLTSVDLSGWDTSKVTNMNSMFYDCRVLTSLDLSGLDISNVTDMYRLFGNCTSLETLYLDGWDINAETTTPYPSLEVFGNCNALRTIYMRGCNSTTITKIEDALTDAGTSIRNNVTIVTE